MSGKLVRALRDAATMLSGRLALAAADREKAVRDFHLLYHGAGSTGGTWADTRWMGRRVLKPPTDLWSYQELIFEQLPELIIETGTFEGGSALFMACVCDAIGRGRVVSIDVERRDDRPAHPRLEFWTGSSTDPAIVARAREAAGRAGGALVILDSDHSEAHVSAELTAYADLVPAGGWLVVEDTHFNGHPVSRLHGPGPMEAVRGFLARDPRFRADEARASKFLLTFNPGGYLRRVR